MSRSCARPGCGNGAAATLSYAYAESVVWLEDLAVESHPMVHDLCGMHAAAVRVPRGWELRDRRDTTTPSGDRAGGGDGGAGLLGAGGAGGLRLVGA